LTPKQYFVDGPVATCPVKGCGLGVHVHFKTVAGKEECQQYGGCSHLVSRERVGKRIVLVYAED